MRLGMGAAGLAAGAGAFARGGGDTGEAAEAGGAATTSATGGGTETVFFSTGEGSVGLPARVWNVRVAVSFGCASFEGAAIEVFRVASSRPRRRRKPFAINSTSASFEYFSAIARTRSTKVCFDAASV